MLFCPPPPHGLPRDLRICSVLTHLPLYTNTQTSVYGKVLSFILNKSVSLAISFIFFLNSLYGSFHVSMCS